MVSQSATRIVVIALVFIVLILGIVALRYSTQTPPDIPPNSVMRHGKIDLELSSKNYRQYKPTRPHVVFILADDLGYNDIGYHAIHGMSALRTPHLDNLAADGVTLENYYVQPVCSPSRSALMTGYSCGGMDHYLHTRTYVYKHPLAKSYVNTTVHADYIDDNPDDTKYVKDKWKGKDLLENETVVWGNEGVYSTTLFTQKAQDVIQKHNPRKPLFLYLAYKNLHTPLQAPDEYIELFKHVRDTGRRTKAAMAYVLDEGIRNVTNALKIAGMWDNTVLVFSSDNGGMLKSSGNNWPLKGGKWSLWEGGIRAVGFVNSPLLLNKVKGTVSTELMHISDWFPTIVDGIAGGKTSQMRKPLDGINQWKMISEGQASPRDEILHNIDPLKSLPNMSATEKKYWQNHLSWNETLNPLIRAGIRSGEWKLLTGDTGPGKWLPPPESGYQKQFLQNKSSHCLQNGTVVKLFNITHDPQETCNLAMNIDLLDVVKNLLHKLHTFSEQSVPAFYPAVDPLANPALHGGAWVPWLDNDIITYGNIYQFRVQPFM